MAIKGNTVFDVFGGPQIISAQVDTPSSFLATLTGGRHEILRKLLDTKIPTIDQGQYERDLFVAAATITGNGAAQVIATFNPPEEFGSFRIDYVHVESFDTSNRRFEVRQAKVEAAAPFNDVQQYVVGALSVEAGGEQALVTKNPQVYWDNSDDMPKQWQSGPLECFRGQTFYDQEPMPREFIEVGSVAAITAAKNVEILFMGERIPNPARYRQLSQDITTTP